MHMLYEFLPVLLFFLTFKLYGIYTATMVGIIATSLQVLLTRCVTGKYDRTQLVTMTVFLVFGGMTLYFHNPIFVKWKPTVVFWIFALAIIITQAFTDKSLMQRMIERAVQPGSTIPPSVWRTINVIWVLFFIIMGSVNLYIAYNYSENTWVNFKVYGITLATLVVSVIQTLYLMPYISEKETTS